MKIRYISTLGLILIFILSSCSKTETIPIKRHSKSAHFEDDDDDPSSGRNSDSSQDPSDPNIEYTSVIPDNPMKTIKDLAFESSCRLLGCNGIFPDSTYGCRLSCADLDKVQSLINCTRPDTYQPAIDCNNSKFKDSNFGIYLNYNVNENTRLEAAFTVYFCGSKIADADHPRRCRLKNIGLIQRPKTFRILFTYPACSQEVKNDTGFDYSMIPCSGGQQTVDMLLEKVKCSSWETNYDSCTSTFQFGIKQDGDYITIDQEIKTFELLDCINNKIGKSCRLK